MPKLTFQGKTFDVQEGKTVLECLKEQKIEIKSDCEFGYCGTDPMVVKKGMENLSPIEDDEKFNIEFNKFPPNVRMACVARVLGDIEIELFN